MLKKGSSGGIYIHPWDITDEGIDHCFDYLENVCGLNELFIAAVYHPNTFLLPHNPRRIIRWDDGSVFFTPQHSRWSQTHIRPTVGECVDTDGYMTHIVEKARQRDWGVLFFVVFHYSVLLPRDYPDACCVDAMGERHRTALCPANPDVRAYDLALVEDLMSTYDGDGIRHESLGFGRWNSTFLCDKVEELPSPRDQFLLSLCFCGHCLERARSEDFDPFPLRRTIRDHLYQTLPQNPDDWDMSEVDEEWARNAFDGQLWHYMDVRCNTVASLYGKVQGIVNKYNGAFMPFGTRNDRDIMACNDYSLFYPHLKRVSLGCRGDSPEEKKATLVEDLKAVPAWAEPEIFHNHRGFNSMEELRDQVLMTRQAGVRHHSFHYYGMSRHYELERIGHACQAWA